MDFRTRRRKALQELELLRRRLFLAKAERLDTAQLELEFGHKLAALDALALQLGTTPPQDAPPRGPPGIAPRAERQAQAAGLVTIRPCQDTI